MHKILLILVVASLLSFAESHKPKPPPFSGAYVWGINGNCDITGGTCTYFPGSSTTCLSWSSCLEVVLNISHNHAYAVAIEIAGPH